MIINGMRLFPLNLASKGLEGYYMDASSRVWSTRAGAAKILAGSNTKSGRYYSLNGSSYRADTLTRVAKQHQDFVLHTGAGPVGFAVLAKAEAAIQANVAKSTPRSHAVDVQTGVAQRGVVIASIVDGKIVLGSDPKIHLTEQSWVDEMARLAQTKPGVTFISMKIVRSVVTGTVIWG
jgi:hypothetical protein